MYLHTTDFLGNDNREFLSAFVLEGMLLTLTNQMVSHTYRVKAPQVIVSTEFLYMEVGWLRSHTATDFPIQASNLITVSFSRAVDLFSDQVIAGKKTFADLETARVPVAGVDVVNKAYIDGLAIPNKQMVEVLYTQGADKFPRCFVDGPFELYFDDVNLQLKFCVKASLSGSMRVSANLICAGVNNAVVSSSQVFNIDVWFPIYGENHYYYFHNLFDGQYNMQVGSRSQVLFTAPDYSSTDPKKNLPTYNIDCFIVKDGLARLWIERFDTAPSRVYMF